MNDAGKPALLHQVFQRNALEGHLGNAAFVENANGFLVYHRKARVTPTKTLIEQHLMFGQPRFSAIKTHLNGDVVAVFGRVGIGEKQDVAFQNIVLSLNADKTTHANRLDKGTARRGMFGPSGAKVARCTRHDFLRGYRACSTSARLFQLRPLAPLWCCRERVC